MNSKIYILLVFFFILFFVSCEMAEEFSEIPEVKYKDFYLTPGVAGMTIATGNLVFSFIDGNGDIGNYDPINGKVVDQNADSLNMFIQGVYKTGNNFEPFANITINLPYLEEGVYRKTIKGEISVEINLTIQTPDTIKFTFYLVDRAKNISNTETTTQLIISELLKQF